MKCVDYVIPNQVQIETVAGLCTVSCNMCPIETHPRKEIMNYDRFHKIISGLVKYKDKFEMITISGIGEPLIDKGIFKKLELLKTHGFKGVGVYTNATPLTKTVSLKLINSGIDTLVISLDGLTKNTQDIIRVGSNIEKVLTNIHRFINLRNELVDPEKLKIILRFTKQEINSHEADEYVAYWKKYLSLPNSEHCIGNDQILLYNVHNHGNIVNINSILLKDFRSKNKQPIKCDELYRRLTIHSNGNVGLCCGDHNELYNNGSALTNDPIEIYNKGHFKNFRKNMLVGDFSSLDICSTCSVIPSILSKSQF